MKKQILILILFVAAIVAGTSNAFGQKTYINYITDPDNDGLSIECITPTPLQNCTADELHPVQGQEYTYTVNASPQTDVRWFVVNYDTLYTVHGDSLVGFNGVLPSTNTDIEPSDGTGSYLYGNGSPVPEYNINPDGSDGTGLYHTIDLTWKYFDGVKNTILLVAYAEDSVGCTNNIVVYRIIPEPAFTIDIAALNDDGDSIAGPTDPLVGECVSPIESALYDPGLGSVLPSETPGDSLIVDYGENWVYFVVNGANYFDSWWPQFQISYDGGYNAIEAAWTYGVDATSATATWHTLTDNGSNLWEGADKTLDAVVAGGGGTSTNAVGDGILPAATGECIVVRVRVDYGTQHEHDNGAESIHFAANGIAYDGDGSDMFDNSANNGATGTGNFEDLKNNGTNGTDCEADGFTNDFMEYQITPRPEVENAIPSGTTTIDTEDKTGDENN